MTCTERRTGYAQADYTLGLQDRTDSGETTADLPSQFSVGSSIDSVGSLKGEEESAEADEPEAALGQTTETCLVQSNVVESDAKLKATAATASGADVPMPSPAAAAAQASASPGAPVLKLPAARPPPPSCPPPPPPPPPPLRKSAAQSATAVGATAADDTEAAVADADGGDAIVLVDGTGAAPAPSDEVPAAAAAAAAVRGPRHVGPPPAGHAPPPPPAGPPPAEPPPAAKKRPCSTAAATATATVSSPGSGACTLTVSDLNSFITGGTGTTVGFGWSALRCGDSAAEEVEADLPGRLEDEEVGQRMEKMVEDLVGINSFSLLEDADLAGHSAREASFEVVGDNCAAASTDSGFRTAAPVFTPGIMWTSRHEQTAHTDF
eukprot:TRINITY_DN12374_c0_g2_i1.p1 TRINITY_DN12374_c0_g2~~TRINITY_DN12374_c0_g2_i1.p1  ORF type:complete len:379 (+),score=106.22 TRINITY_DN12374_c0_g2_i1:34-1170(+)